MLRTANCSCPTPLLDRSPRVRLRAACVPRPIAPTRLPGAGVSRNQNVARSARVSDPAVGRTAGLQSLSTSAFMETFGRAKCWVGRPAHSVLKKQVLAAMPRRGLWPTLLVLLVHAAVCLVCPLASAQLSAPGKETKLSATEELALEQSRIADNYSRLEQLMIRMAEAEGANNPQRAALLKQAVQQSATRLTRGQLNAVADLLKPPAQMNRALDQQQQALQDLNDLLQLLLSENRSDRLRDEQTRIRAYLKEVERIRRLEQGLQGRTEGGADAERLQQEQDRVASRTGDLAKEIERDQQSNAAEPDSGEDAGDRTEPGAQDGKGDSAEPSEPTEPRSESPQNDTPPDGQEPAETPRDPDKPAPQERSGSTPQERSQQGDGQQSEGQQSKGQQGKGQQSPEQGEPSASNPQSPENVAQSQTPEDEARRRIEAAEQRMQEAQKRLAEANRQEAIVKQEQALQELEKAEAALEQILRQLREEEMERMLALLENRFRRMLRSQLQIYESTKQIDKMAATERRRQIDIQASKLSFEESKLVGEADRALNLLREEGSSVAFPETVEQMRDEMIMVSDRLSVVQVGIITQAAEEDIIAALEEMIGALQKAQKDLENQQQQQQQQPMQQPPNPGDRPLVDQLAELKMIRSLQLRVNKRTQRFAQLLKDMNDPVGQLFDEDLLQQLQKLSATQLRIHRVTHDIVVGKNR